MARKEDRQPDFEQALSELEAIVESLEDGELSLEESLKRFEKGIKLTRQCRGALEKAEQQVQTLVGSNGNEQLEDLDSKQQTEGPGDDAQG